MALDRGLTMVARVHKSMKDRDRGFTLIELLVVIIIIGILAAIAIPVFLNQRKKGIDASLKADLKSLALVEEAWIVDHPSEAGTKVPAALSERTRSPGNILYVAVIPASAIAWLPGTSATAAVGTQTMCFMTRLL